MRSGPGGNLGPRFRLGDGASLPRTFLPSARPDAALFTPPSPSSRTQRSGDPGSIQQGFSGARAAIAPAGWIPAFAGMTARVGRWRGKTPSRREAQTLDGMTSSSPPCPELIKGRGSRLPRPFISIRRKLSAASSFPSSRGRPASRRPDGIRSRRSRHSRARPAGRRCGNHRVRPCPARCAAARRRSAHGR